MNNETLIKTINIPPEQRKRTTITGSIWYDTLEIYANKVVGYLNQQQNIKKKLLGF